MTLSLRRNSDKNVPASHVLELAFHSAREFEGGGIDGVLGITMKLGEQARGRALASTTVKTSDGIFVVRLSESDAERRRNLILLRSMPWLDISVAYRNQRQAVLSIEKGIPGSAAFLAVLEVPSH